MPADTPGPRPFEDLSPTGLLWLINRTVFHPRGYALALSLDDTGRALGWEILGDGSQPWTFAGDETEHHLQAARTLPPPPPLR